MSTEAFQVATAVLAASSLGLGVVAYGFHTRVREYARRIDDARAHVASLKASLTNAFHEQDVLTRRCAELDEAMSKVNAQRERALRAANERNRRDRERKAEMQAQAAVKTLSELKQHPLRPRAEVLADIRRSKAAKTVSSAG